MAIFMQRTEAVSGKFVHVPKHTTNDPVKRAFHIAEGEARKRYDNLSISNAVFGNDPRGDLDYFGNTVDKFEAILPEFVHR